MYRDLGLPARLGQRSDRAREHGHGVAPLRLPDLPAQADRRLRATQTRDLLSEYCVELPRPLDRPYGSARLPASDDVLAKWMALTADERRLIDEREPAPRGTPDTILTRVRSRPRAHSSRWEREQAGAAATPVVFASQ